jgi:hypothetical protein
MARRAGRVGISMVIVGFEFDYGRSSENPVHLPGAADRRVQTSGHDADQRSCPYVTRRGRVPGDAGRPVTNFGTNFGGGSRSTWRPDSRADRLPDLRAEESHLQQAAAALRGINWPF